MSVKEIMTTKLITVSPSDSLGRIKTIIDKLHVNHVLVVENLALLGIVSDRDVLRHTSPFVGGELEVTRDSQLLMTLATKIMTRDPVTIHQDCSVNEAAHVILEKQISLLPVINSDGIVVGVVSWKDVLRFAIQ